MSPKSSKSDIITSCQKTTSPGSPEPHRRFTGASQNHTENEGGRGSPNNKGGTTRKSTPSVFIGNGGTVLVTLLVCLLLWGVFGILLVVFGPSWGAFGGLLGVFGSSWGVFGPFGDDFGDALDAFGVSLGRLCGGLGESLDRLGCQ